MPQVTMANAARRRQEAMKLPVTVITGARTCTHACEGAMLPAATAGYEICTSSRVGAGCAGGCGNATLVVMHYCRLPGRWEDHADQPHPHGAPRVTQMADSMRRWLCCIPEIPGVSVTTTLLCDCTACSAIYHQYDSSIRAGRSMQSSRTSLVRKHCKDIHCDQQNVHTTAAQLWSCRVHIALRAWRSMWLMLCLAVT